MESTDLNESQIAVVVALLKSDADAAPPGDRRNYLDVIHRMVASNTTMGWPKFHRYMSGIDEMSPETARKIRKALGLARTPPVTVPRDAGMPALQAWHMSELRRPIG